MAIFSKGLSKAAWVEAMGGLMGRVADEAAIHFNVLNRSKGPAVRGLRTQSDRNLYRDAMQAAIAKVPNLQVFLKGSIAQHTQMWHCEGLKFELTKLRMIRLARACTSRHVAASVLRVFQGST
eukprot:498925-Pleurochrysis_carterae.AAC.4